MTKESTLTLYAEKFQRVIDHIRNNIGSDLALDDLADIACMSRFHFHRAYHAFYGETIHATISRLRMHTAAFRLLTSRESIAEIAQTVSFTSAAAFNRRFKREFGETPDQFRKNRSSDHWTMHAMPSHTRSGEQDMQSVDIQHFDGATLATIRHVGPYMDIGQCFEKLFGHLMPLMKHPLTDMRAIGLYHDDPSSVPATELRSDAGFEIPDDLSLPDSLTRTTIPAMTCAVYRHKGPYADLEKIYTWLYGSWLPQSGKDLDDYPCFEVYLNSPADTAPSDLITDIHVPVK